MQGVAVYRATFKDALSLLQTLANPATVFDANVEISNTIRTHLYYHSATLLMYALAPLTGQPLKDAFTALMDHIDAVQNISGLESFMLTYAAVFSFNPPLFNRARDLWLRLTPTSTNDFRVILFDASFSKDLLMINGNVDAALRAGQYWNQPNLLRGTVLAKPEFKLVNPFKLTVPTLGGTGGGGGGGFTFIRLAFAATVATKEQITLLQDTMVATAGLALALVAIPAGIFIATASFVPALIVGTALGVATAGAAAFAWVTLADRFEVTPQQVPSNFQLPIYFNKEIGLGLSLKYLPSTGPTAPANTGASTGNGNGEPGNGSGESWSEEGKSGGSLSGGFGGGGFPIGGDSGSNEPEDKPDPPEESGETGTSGNSEGSGESDLEFVIHAPAPEHPGIDEPKKLEEPED